MIKSGELENKQQPDQLGVDRGGSRLGQAITAGPKPGFGKKALVAIACFLLVLGVVWAVVRNHIAANQRAAAAHAGPPPVPVVAGQVTEKDVPINLDGLGTVQAFNTVTVHVQVDGELQKIAFIEGQDVRVGDLLAQIDPRPFQAQLAQAEAKKAQDEAQLANARLDLKRDAEQLAAKIIPQQTYDTQKALVDQLTATVNADQAAIDMAKVQLAYTTIVSPIDGRTGIRLVDEGNIVHVTDSNGLVVITQLHPISVVFTLPEQTLPEIRQQDRADPITVLAVGRDNTTVLDTGKLAVIDNQIDTTTGTIRLKAIFHNENLRLWPGQFVNARLLLTTRKNGVVVPAPVVQRGPEGPYAFVIKSDQTVEVRPIQVAQIENGEALIDSGLRPGERVVVEGQYRLQAGSHVKPASSDKPVDAGS
jgi:multidrug efflux system membrane fusion protein